MLYASLPEVCIKSYDVHRGLGKGNINENVNPVKGRWFIKIVAISKVSSDFSYDEAAK